jgi:hypothetical protein
MSQILTETTSAANSDIQVLSKNDVVTICMTGSQTASEYGDVQYSDDGGVTWYDLYQDGSQVRLHSLNTCVTIEGPLIYRVAKEATTGAVGVIKFGG